MRISGWLQLAGTILIALLFVGVATIAFSAAHLSVTTPNGGGGPTTFGPNVVNQTSSINLTNGGFLSITGLSFTAITYVVGGPVVGEASAPAVTVGPGVEYHVPVILSVDVGPGTPGQRLLVSSASLQEEGWLNATFGYLLTVSVEVSPSNPPNWGAPFSGFNVTATVSGSSATVTVRFSNDASIAVAGEMSVALTSSAENSCGVALIPIDAPSGGGVYTATGTTSIVTGCVPATAVASLSNTSPGYSFTLPGVPVG